MVRMKENEIMVSKLSIKDRIPKTEKRRKSDSLDKRKREMGIYVGSDEDCDWTVDGSPSIELPDLSAL